MKVVPFTNHENRNAEEIQEYIDLLPAWFTERMLSDTWNFGLLMATGDIIAIQYIHSITQDASGNLWLDAKLQNDCIKDSVMGHKIFVAPTSRDNISINSSHVVAAFELADS